MTPQQAALIKSSWQSVVPIKEKAAELFYGRLFELDPMLKPLFKGDMKEQGRKLMAMINTVVVNLEQIESLVPAVQSLGKRHVDYGVTSAHYGTVGAALLWTLGAGLGDAFTDEVEGAWTAAYTLLSNVMIDASATA